MNSNENIQIELQEGGLDQGIAIGAVGAPSHGGQAFFFGVVRDLNDGKKVLGVHYDCYAPLTQKVFLEICEQAVQKVGEDVCVFLSHAHGYLKVGEVSVAIGVSTPHRSEAFQACRFIIEELKKRAPIWKQEHYVDGKSEWVKGHALCAH